MRNRLTDHEKEFLLECESNCGRDFTKCRNRLCTNYQTMIMTLKKMWGLKITS